MSNKPDMIKPERYTHTGAIKKQIRGAKEFTGLTNKDLGAAAFGLGVIAAGVKAIKDIKNKKSNVSPPKPKPKFSNSFIWVAFLSKPAAIPTGLGNFKPNNSLSRLLCLMVYMDFIRRALNGILKRIFNK